MALRFIGIDPETDTNDSPTIWVDEETGDFILKGWRITDSAILAETGPDHREGVIRWPARMAQFMREARGDGKGSSI